VSVTVAQASFSVGAGHDATIRIGLNTAGRKLLTQFFTLPSTVSFSGAASGSRRITFAYPLVTPPPDASWVTWTWTNQPCGSQCFTLATTRGSFFGVPQLLRTAKVKLRCFGAGCPRSGTFRPRRGKVSVGRLFAGRKLAPGTRVQFVITAPGAVGRLVQWRMVAGSKPIRTVQCLPPGARGPRSCHGV
jgi:hypothetical protein